MWFFIPRFQPFFVSYFLSLSFSLFCWPLFNFDFSLVSFLFHKMHLFIHSVRHSGDLYSASSRDYYYSEALSDQSRTKKDCSVLSFLSGLFEYLRCLFLFYLLMLLSFCFCFLSLIPSSPLISFFHICIRSFLSGSFSIFSFPFFVHSFIHSSHSTCCSFLPFFFISCWTVIYAFLKFLLILLC